MYYWPKASALMRWTKMLPCPPTPTMLPPNAKAMPR